MNAQERAVMQQALEALEHHGGRLPWITFVEVLNALKAALAQEQVEPSGYCTLEQLVVMQRTVPSPDKIAIYTAPPKAEPAQEPVAWNWMLDGRPYGHAYYGNPPDADIVERAAIAGRTVRLLYAKPFGSKPLTDKDMLDIIDDAMEGGSLLDLVRAIERKVRGEEE